MQTSNRRRCVLLLDDAAHAFSPEQQREFFEIFANSDRDSFPRRQQCTPESTAYSANFHVGHEAELLEVWYRPDDPSFLSTMWNIVDRRLPPALNDRLEGRKELVEYLALASFGLPRGFLVMLSQLLGVEEDDTTLPTRRVAAQAVTQQASAVTNIFRSLGEKLPRYVHFVEVGFQLQGQMAKLLARWNAAKDVDQKAVAVGLRDPLGPELTRILSMLEYAGAVRRLDTISRGRQGVYHRYVLHSCTNR